LKANHKPHYPITHIPPPFMVKDKGSVVLISTALASVFNDMRMFL